MSELEQYLLLVRTKTERRGPSLLFSTLLILVALMAAVPFTWAFYYVITDQVR